MSRNLNMSLEEIIAVNNSVHPRRTTNNSRARHHTSESDASHGPIRRSFWREPPRANPYPMREPTMIAPPEMVMMRSGWQNRESESGTKLYLSNLDCGVSNNDILLLFSDFGELMHYSIHYDRSGRSKGTAEVVFAHREDALASIEKYNNVHLDGKPMQIALVGVDMHTDPSMLVTAPSYTGRSYGYYSRGVQERYAYDPRGQGQHNDVRGRGFTEGQRQRQRQGQVQGQRQGQVQGQRQGQGRVRGHSERATAEELDADLERYLASRPRI